MSVCTRYEIKMTKVIFAVILTILTFALTNSATTRSNVMPKESMTTAMMDNQDSSIDNSSDIDVIAIMNTCNDSYRIEMAYLEALNSTGSFIDETDRTPKCFIRCVLENVGIVSEDGRQFNPARAAAIFAGERNGKPINDIGDMTAMCADRQEKCACERSYQFLKCLMKMEIEKYETPKN